jgi:hypothetical protein
LARSSERLSEMNAITHAKDHNDNNANCFVSYVFGLGFGPGNQNPDNPALPIYEVWETQCSAAAEILTACPGFDEPRREKPDTGGQNIPQFNRGVTYGDGSSIPFLIRIAMNASFPVAKNLGSPKAPQNGSRCTD